MDGRSFRVSRDAEESGLYGRGGSIAPFGKGKLHLIFVGVADRDHSVAEPHWASLPLLDNLPVGLKDGFVDAGQRLATPVCEVCDQLVNTLRWIRWAFM